MSVAGNDLRRWNYGMRGEPGRGSRAGRGGAADDFVGLVASDSLGGSQTLAKRLVARSVTPDGFDVATD
jgi:hypothetical protein